MVRKISLFVNERGIITGALPDKIPKKIKNKKTLICPFCHNSIEITRVQHGKTYIRFYYICNNLKCFVEKGSVTKKKLSDGNICFTYKHFLKQLKKAKRKDIIVFDESNTIEKNKSKK